MVPADRLASTVFNFIDKSPTRTAESLQRQIHITGDPSSITAQSLMIPVSVTISDSQTLADAMHILLSSHLDQVPVLDEKRQIVGVIRALDIVREWVEDTPGKTTRR